MYTVQDCEKVYGVVNTLEEALDLAIEYNAEIFDANGELVEVAPF